MRVEHLNDLSVKMKTSGYNTVFIRKVMVAGIKSYEKKLKKQQAGSYQCEVCSTS